MISLTAIARPLLVSRDRRSLRAAADAEATQRRILASLVGAARSTEMGRRHDFPTIRSYADFASRVPMVGYEEIRPDCLRMVKGESDILWPGRCRRFAQSSGTSGGKSKYIPLTGRSLARCHMAGGGLVVARYLALHPESRLFDGRSFILGGSYATELDAPRGVHVGDLSATLIDTLNPLAATRRLPSKSVALMERWEEKLPALVEATRKADVRSISGVPSWFLTVIRRVMEAEGAKELHDVWPRLEVFFHGGIAFGPYRREYDSLIDPERMHYMETYNASEGFFALQDDPADPSMMLLTDVDVFYELIPVNGSDADAIPLWEAVPGEVYELVITSSNGLWRYRIGDTVEVTSTSPRVKIRIAGRTRCFINAFGEELMVYNADAGIAAASQATGARVADYTAAPVFPADGRKGRHQWLVEFATAPDSTEAFARRLDSALCSENSDYQAKRTGSIFLDAPEVIALPRGTFDRWLGATGRLGGQRKVPRLANDRRIADEILNLTKLKQ